MQPFQIIFNPTSAAELARMRRFAPRLPTGMLFGSDQKPWLREGTPAWALGAEAVHPEHVLCTPARMAAWRAGGFAVAAWTVNDPIRALQLGDLGVDAFITDYPARILEALSRVKRLG